MNPEEACMVHQDIGATHSLGVHWGTYMMSDEHYLDPPKDFEKARINLGLPEGSCFTTHLGETFVLYPSNHSE
jgi:N-acyl-phosphatidylethanolamine-hydrolysing phospholipase D